MTDEKRCEYGFESLALHAGQDVGDAKGRVYHQASTTHSQLAVDEQKSTSVTPDYVRLSVGLEPVDDILYDLDQPLSGA
jgi:O-acetylhomoserine (thiol)-lyase